MPAWAARARVQALRPASVGEILDEAACQAAGDAPGVDDPAVVEAERGAHAGRSGRGA